MILFPSLGCPLLKILFVSCTILSGHAAAAAPSPPQPPTSPPPRPRHGFVQLSMWFPRDTHLPSPGSWNIWLGGCLGAAKGWFLIELSVGGPSSSRFNLPGSFPATPIGKLRTLYELKDPVYDPWWGVDSMVGGEKRTQCLRRLTSSTTSSCQPSTHPNTAQGVCQRF